MKKLYALGFSMVAALALNAQNLTWPSTDGRLVADAAEGLPVGPAGSWRADLTQDAQFQHGAIWRATPVNLANNFKLTVLMNFGNRNETGFLNPVDPGGGADGIAFVIHNTTPVAKSGLNIGAPIGAFGQKIGYASGADKGIVYDFPQQFTVEFDTWWNPAESDPTDAGLIGGPNHVAFMKGGSANHATNAAYGGGYGTASTLPFILEDGKDKRVTFEYTYVNATTQTLKVTVEKLEAPYGSATFMFSGDIMSAAGAGTNYIGFTSATGESTNRHQVEILADEPPIITNCGQLRTQTMGGWGQKAAGNNNGAYRDANFATAFAAAPFNGKVTVGSTAPGGRYMTWSSASGVQNFLPSGSTPRIIDAAVNGMNNVTSSTYKNNAVGQILTLSLTVRFDDTDPAFAPSSTPIGNFIIGSGPFVGWTVRNFLAEANKVVGGLPSSFTVDQVHAVAGTINEAYDNGVTKNNYLTCPTTVARGGRDGQEVTDANLMDAPQEARLIANVFPNPTKGIVNLRVANNTDRIEVRVVNARGMVVERMNTNSQVISLDLKKYGAGIYMVQIISGTSVRTERVIVQD